MTDFWNEFDYQQDIEIDEYDFVTSWLNQPKLFLKYANACSDARKIKNTIHEELKTHRSKLIRKCKRNHEKATGPEVEAYYRVDKKYKKLKKKLIKAEDDYDTLENAVSAFRMRKYSLEFMQELFMKEYYAEPNTKKANSRFVDDVVKKETTNKIKKRMKSKRTK